MNIASVPCRCGQSWTVPGTGPSERGTPANCGAEVRELGVDAGALHRGDDVRGLGDHRRAGRVEDHAAGPDQVEGRADQLALQHHQREQVVGLAPPPRLGAAAQRAQPGAGRVDEHPVEDAGTVRRQRPVGSDHADHARDEAAVGGERAAYQPGAHRQPLAGDQPRAAFGGQRGQQPGLAARVRRTGPARARRGPRGVPRPAPGRPAATPRPGRRRAPRRPRARTAGRHPPTPRRTASRGSAPPAARHGWSGPAAQPG